ncbi:MAG: O-antigen ligase family protein [Magnetospirillum sp.]|nr:O-antigen ligase family protein [Magnetospirillum sp.]
MNRSAKLSWSALVAIPAWFLIPGFGCYLPNALIVVLSICAGVGLAEMIWRRDFPRSPAPVVWSILALAGWAAVTAFWAPDGGAAVRGAAGLLGVAVILVILWQANNHLSAPEKRWIATAYLIGTFVVVAMLSVDILSNAQLAAWFRGYDINDEVQNELAHRSLNRGITLLAFYAPVYFLVAWRCTIPYLRPVALAMGAVALVYCLNWGKDAIVLAGAAAILFASLLVRPWPATRWLLTVGFCTYVAVIPFAARLIPPPQVIWEEYRHVPHSLQHRLFIWGFTSQRVAEKPFLGWGMNSAKIIPGGDQDVTVGWGAGMLQWRPLPLHPHNAVLQWWLELGMVGALIATLGVVSLISTIWRQPEQARRMAGAASLGAALVVSLLSFGAWQSWWLAGMIIVAWMLKITDPLDQA